MSKESSGGGGIESPAEASTEEKEEVGELWDTALFCTVQNIAI